MANIVFDTLGQYDLIEKLFGITTDNAGNNGTMCKALQDLLEELGVLWDHEVPS